MRNVVRNAKRSGSHMALQHTVPLLSTEPHSQCVELHSLALLTIQVFWELDAVSSGFERKCCLHHQGSNNPSAISLYCMTLQDSEGTMFIRNIRKT